jgi:predicted DNA-binding transcriptional regulator YafY
MIDECLIALNNQIKMDIAYCNESGEITRRKIHPYFLLIGDNRSYLVGYCELRGEIRTFRTSRILTHIIRNNEFFTRTKSFEQYKDSILLTGKFTVYDGSDGREYSFINKNTHTNHKSIYDGVAVNYKPISNVTKKTGCFAVILVFALIILIILL